jgi:hypothetical protein
VSACETEVASTPLGLQGGPDEQRSEELQRATLEAHNAPASNNVVL